MARIKYGSLVSSISGSVGSATFQNSRSGSILRSKPIQPKRSSSKQLDMRSKMKSLQSSWLALTPADRLKWIFFVTYSEQHIIRDKNILISGYNLFLKYQFSRLLYDLPLLISWTYNPLLVYPKIANITKSGSIYYFYFDSYVNSSLYYFILGLGPRQNASRKFNTVGVRFMKVDFKSDFLYYLTDLYPAAFGVDLQVSDSVSYTLYWFSVINPILTGYQSGVLTVNTI